MSDTQIKTTVVHPEPIQKQAGMQVDLSWVIAVAGLIATVIAIVTAFKKLMKEGVTDLEKKVDHNRNNQNMINQKLEGSIEKLTVYREQDLVRVAKLEANYEHIKEGLRRVEDGQKDLIKHVDTTFDKQFGQLSESIRELRNVEKK